MMRGEEPFIYDKKVLEEVCWQRTKLFAYFCHDEMSIVYKHPPPHRFIANFVSRAKHGTGHRCTNKQLLYF
jgi:hypothetical protein